ncbi:MAG: hypothetical protein ACI8PT_001181 [Gammaproteobacteria bacterium]
MTDIVERFEAMLATGKDSALLRYSLGVEYSKREDFARAAEHLSASLDADSEQSAAWKLYGAALRALDDLDAAARAYERGIVVAEQKGDRQAVKEMTVFLRRINKQRQPPISDGG